MSAEEQKRIKAAPVENDGKMMGKWWENGGKIGKIIGKLGKWWEKNECVLTVKKLSLLKNLGLCSCKLYETTSLRPNPRNHGE